MLAFRPEFALNLPALRIRFGPGIRHSIGAEIDAIGARRALFLSTPQQAQMVEAFAAETGRQSAGVFAGAAMHTPVDVTETAMSAVASSGADCLVSIGGGSTIGLGKAIALRTGLPQIVVPTTYAGSEATPILGQTEGGKKTTLKDPKVQPQTVLYDAELVATLPIGMTVTSALNAIAHAAEALYAQDRNPMSSTLALDGVRAFANALPRVLGAPSDLEARGETLYGAWLCGSVLGQVGMSLHHKLCHTLGGSFDLPHADTHAIILPHAIAYNERAVPELLAPIAELFGSNTASAGLYEFSQKMGAPMRLSDLGVTETNLDEAADQVVQNPYWNPAPLERAQIRDLLDRAWRGAPPA